MNFCSKTCFISGSIDTSNPCLVCSTLVGSGLVCSALVGSSLVCTALVGSGLVCPTWTWLSVSSPNSTSAPPPSWIIVCVERLEAALWGGGGGSATNPVLEITPTHHISCTTAAHHPRTAFPIHHCTNHTAVTNHSFALIVSPHLHLIHTHTYKQHTSMHTLRSLVQPRLTFPSGFPECVSLDCLYDSDRLLPAFWPCLPFDILSVCRLPRPLHCPCCWFCLAFVTPVTVSEPCLFELLLLINKAAFGSNDTASSLQLHCFN